MSPVSAFDDQAWRVTIPPAEKGRPMENHDHITRGSLFRRGGLLAAGLATAGWTASEAAGGPAGVASGAISCVLAPELTEGPYYVSDEKLRRDITEGKAGVPLLLQLTVVNASTCRALANAAVDVWHCDALGVYSGAVANNPGTNFLRGVQRTNAKGVATFETIYPGWYPGRAVHVHVKVHVGGSVVHTGQLFFPAAVTNAVYRKSPYRTHGSTPDTPNPQDAIFRNGGSKGMLTLRKTRSGYVGAVSMGVHGA
jgi:protocatechuate 3,4-dioxygenase beta subunit